MVSTIVYFVSMSTRNNDNHRVISVPLNTFYGVSLVLSFLGGSYLTYNRYLKQYRNIRDIPVSLFKRKWLYGRVTAVGDGDNFHFYHLPGGFFGGWGWLRKTPELELNTTIKTVDSKIITASDKPSHQMLSKSFFKRIKDIVSMSSSQRKLKLRSNYYMNLKPRYKGKRSLPTIPIRISGIDAPERAHFGNEGQPFGDEALNWLRYQLLGKRVWIKPLRIDQYNRCVARAVYWSWLGGWKDIGLQMIKEGLAVVYEGKIDAEFDGKKKIYQFHEFLAKSQRKGLWIQRSIETPSQFKKKL